MFSSMRLYNAPAPRTSKNQKYIALLASNYVQNVIASV